MFSGRVMKLRLIVGGCFLIVLGSLFFVVRGLEPALVLPVVGVVLLAVGLLWKQPKNTGSARKDAG